MLQSITLPDAMPDIVAPTLFVVCDTHQCRFFTVGGHRMVEQEGVQSKEAEFTDRKGMMQSPAAVGKGGMISGVDELNQFEKTRMSQFAKEAVQHIDHVIRDQKIEAVHLSAPAKFLSTLRDHLSVDIKKLLQNDMEGNFVKEPPLKLLLRFRPDLEVAAKELRAQESYSPGNRPPKTYNVIIASCPTDQPSRKRWQTTAPMKCTAVTSVRTFMTSSTEPMTAS